MPTHKLVCEKTPKAIVAETAPHTHDELNLLSHVELHVRGEMPGYDQAPVLVAGGCGAKIEIPDEPWLWDVNTEVRSDGSEWIVERHVAVRCPACGVTADYLTQPLATPEPFLYPDLGKRERALLLDPIVQEVFAALPEDKRPKLEEAFRRGFLWVHEGRLLPKISGGMTDIGWAFITEGAVALSAGVSKTILGWKSGAAVALQMTFREISFDGVTAAAVPVTVELAYCSWATNSPGTNSTGTTEAQEYGPLVASGAADWTGAKNWTTEPTALTVSDETYLHPQGLPVLYDYPLGKELDSNAAEGWVLRCNAPAAVNVKASMKMRHV